MDVRDVMSRNFARIRQERRLTTRALEARLLPLGSKLTSPVISRIEKGPANGGRALGLGDWLAASIAMNATPASFFEVRNWESTDPVWEWARGVERVEIAPGFTLPAERVVSWIEGAYEYGSRVNTETEFSDELRESPERWRSRITPASTHLREYAFQNPAYGAAATVERIMFEIITGESTLHVLPGNPSLLLEHPGTPFDITREDMIRELRKWMDRLRLQVKLLEQSVEEGATPGKYKGDD